LSVSKSLRWVSNWLASTLNSVLLSLVFPVLAAAAVSYQLMQARRYWLHTLISSEDNTAEP